MYLINEEVFNDYSRDMVFYLISQTMRKRNKVRSEELKMNDDLSLKYYEYQNGDIEIYVDYTEEINS